MGRDWLTYIMLNWKNLFEIHTMTERTVTAGCPVRLQKILDKYAEVFKEGLGTMKSVKVRIQVNQEAQPRFFKAHPIPYALKPKSRERVGETPGSRDN